MLEANSRPAISGRDCNPDSGGNRGDRAVQSEGAQPNPMASVAVPQLAVRENLRAGLSARCRDRDEPAPNQATTRRCLSMLHRLARESPCNFAKTKDAKFERTFGRYVWRSSL